jgi:hypothetical protein
MKIFAESAAISKDPNFVMRVDIYEVDLFLKMKALMTLAAYQFPDYPPIRTGILRDVIGEKMAK